MARLARIPAVLLVAALMALPPSGAEAGGGRRAAGVGAQCGAATAPARAPGVRSARLGAGKPIYKWDPRL